MVLLVGNIKSDNHVGDDLLAKVAASERRKPKSNARLMNTAHDPAATTPRRSFDDTTSTDRHQRYSYVVRREGLSIRLGQSLPTSTVDLLYSTFYELRSSYCFPSAVASKLRTRESMKQCANLRRDHHDSTASAEHEQWYFAIFADQLASRGASLSIRAAA